MLTTHIDKGHVHNHIIFCAVDMVNQRKYVSNRQSYAYIRRTSDRLCKEHGLSVVMPGQDRGKSYAEWDAHRKGTSWKAKLKASMAANWRSDPRPFESYQLTNNLSLIHI